MQAVLGPSLQASVLVTLSVAGLRSADLTFRTLRPGDGADIIGE